MKFTAAIASSLALFGGLAAADYEQQSKPFHIFVVSDDKKWHGQPVGAIHVGANIQSLVPGARDTFHFNSTKGAPAALPGSTSLGLLGHRSEGSSNVYQQSMQIVQNLFDTIAVPTFEGSNEYYDTTPVAIGRDNLFFLTDTSSGKAKSVRRWYICKTKVAAYENDYIVWNAGPGKPSNPTCVKVDLKKVRI